MTELVLAAVTTTSRDEVDWITEGVGQIFPEAWHRFERAAYRGPGERIVGAYARRLAGSDAAEQRRAAADWNAWEAAHVSFDGSVTPGRWADDEGAAAVFAILSRMDRIAEIPAALIHGRRDVSGPAVTPWRLHRLWPASRLTIVEGEGHGGPEMLALARRACDGFAA